MSARDKNLYSILIAMLILGAYVFVVYAPQRTEIQRTEGLINRRLNRIETRAVAAEPPSESTKELKVQMEDLAARRDAVLANLAKRQERFASLARVDDIKQLRLEISSLAESHGLRVLRFGEIQNSDLADTEALLQAEAETEYARPLMSLEVEGGFIQIQDFILGLRSLTKSASIARFAIQAPDFEPRADPD
ncbi:MAG: hypothetical protein AAF401_14795, partial [Pseudomonadota bacterium]